MDKISIIVPIYKVEKYLPKCIESIINQTYKNLEIILVDDGSPDSCGRICDEYAKKDDRIKVIHKENGGLSDARNCGIDAATGEYLGFVDSDDYIIPDMYEKLYRALKASNADMSICNFRYIWENKNEENTEMNEDPPIKDDTLLAKEILCKKMFEPKSWYWVIAWNKLYKKDIFQDIRYPVGKQHEDEFIIHRLLFKCEKVACVSEILYLYMQRKESIMGQQYNIRRLDVAEALIDRVEFTLAHKMENEACKYYMLLMEVLISWCAMSYRKKKDCKNRLKELKIMFDDLYKKLPKRNFQRKERIKIKAFIVSPTFYAKGEKFRKKAKLNKR